MVGKGGECKEGGEVKKVRKGSVQSWDSRESSDVLELEDEGSGEYWCGGYYVVCIGDWFYNGWYVVYWKFGWGYFFIVWFVWDMYGKVCYGCVLFFIVLG